MTSSIDDFNPRDFRWMRNIAAHNFCQHLAAYVYNRYKQFEPLAEESPPLHMTRGSASAYGDVLEEMIRLLKYYRDED